VKVIKLGFVGSGFVANFHARALTQVRNVEIAGITSKIKKQAEQLSAMVRKHNLGEGTVFSSITEMAKYVDAIAIFAPNLFRIEILEEIINAVKLGAELKGVICEKPLARNVIEAQRMLNLVKSVGLKTAYFENQIFMKAIRAQLIQLQPQQKSMGSLVLTRSAEEHGGPHEAWFWDPTKQGGGVLCDMGCHSIAVGWYALNPIGKSPMFLKPISVSAECALLKWGLPRWRDKLLKKYGIDYNKAPAEDFTTGIITYQNPESGQLVKAQFTNSWMFEKQGLRLFMDGMGPGYAFEINTLQSSLQVFVGDEAVEAVGDAETALEKATASRGLLAVQYNEADLYGYTDENEDAARAFLNNKDAFLSWDYGLEITKLVMAAYMSAERKKTIDLTDPGTQQELKTFIPQIQQGRGREVLFTG
jgi:predicted dehydrogenase